MSLLKCPKCGEMFSDSYHTCPFCAEDEEFYGGKKPKNAGRRMDRPKTPSILGPALIVVLLLLAAFLVYTFLGDRIADLFRGDNKPGTEQTDPGSDPKPSGDLTLDKTELTLEIGDTAFLIASGADEVTWTSSDPAVVSVDGEGNLVASDVGQATVTAIAGKQSVACTVMVEDAPEPKSDPNKELTLSLNVNSDPPRRSDGTYEFDMSVGAEYELYVNGTDSAVTWKSSDESAVTVDSSGIIRRIAYGDVTITGSADGQSVTAIVH